MTFFKLLKEYLFPRFCVSCGKEGEWWCRTCRGKITPFNFDSPLGRGRGGLATSLDKLTALFHYTDNPALEKLIKDFKYNYVRDIDDLWTEILSDAKLTFATDAVFVPVPLHDRRLRERGFNQAAELSRILSKIYHRPERAGELRRVRVTSQQAGMTREDRLNNVAGAFAWVGEEVAPARVVLVDDVYTTGATMGECAKVLRANGAKYIEALVLAHG
ncbi:MAG: ComF family protein [Patescibacteria group bacterium]